MNVQYVPTAAIHQVWDQVSPYLAEALAHGKGDYTVEQARVYITKGDWLTLVAVDDAQIVQGAAAVQFFNRPNDRVAFVVALGGKLVTSQQTFEQLKQICAANGATAIEGTARESTARLWTRYGFEEKYRIVGVKI